MLGYYNQWRLYFWWLLNYQNLSWNQDVKIDGNVNQLYWENICRSNITEQPLHSSLLETKAIAFIEEIGVEQWLPEKS